jgi:lipopolysaccharide biosynthesis regulator YciM
MDALQGDRIGMLRSFLRANSSKILFLEVPLKIYSLRVLRFMVITLLFLLLPVAAFSGWYAARYSAQFTKNVEGSLSRDYLIGLNYLLNEQPDKAVDLFIKMLEVNSETVETHLALGVLFRRRGEVDRAIRIHQNLIARPQLPKQQRIEAMLALGQDYLRAGVLDRAERLLLEVIEEDSQNAIIALHNLLDIYQQQKRWDVAITMAEKLLAKGEMVQANIAHYFCELAVNFSAQGQLEQAKRCLQQALAMDPNCARASLLQGELYFKADNFNAALLEYQRVKIQDPDYLSETVSILVKIYEHLGDKIGLMEYLQTTLQEYPRTSLILAITNRLQQTQGNVVALEFMAKQLHRSPSLRGLQRLILLQLETAEEKVRSSFLLLQQLITSLLKNKPIYRCVNCGFSSKILHWLCPTCKNWNVVKPIKGLEGD